jgi:type II secretory pathway component PulK
MSRFPPMRRLRDYRGDRAFVLVMTVLVLSILVVLGYAFSYSTGVYGSTARNARDALRRECAAESALNRATALLRANGGAGFDSLDQPWAADDLSVQVGAENVRISIVDENRKLNVNRAARPPTDPTQGPDLRDVLERLVEIAGGNRSDFDAICAWIDPATPGPHDNLAPKSPLPMIAGLRRIPDLSPKLFDQSSLKPRLDSLLSTHPERINLNTARREVLDALWDDPTISLQVIEQRRQQPFRSDADIAQFVQQFNSAPAGPNTLAQALSAQSDYFTVTATPADGPNEALEALVRRTDAVTEILYTKRVSKEVAP